MEEEKREEINETGSIELTHNNRKHNIQLLTIIGEIEGHEAVSGNTKATKYEHLLPKLAEVEDNEEIEGLLILLNTLGGDVEAGLAICRDDCITQQADCVFGSWRKSFHRRTACGFSRLFFYCS